MKNQLFFLLAIILSSNCFSQISFEKGYYINNNNQKIECLIKNLDWRNNPSEIEYKLLEDNEPKVIKIKAVKEFGIDSNSKYVRSTVNIDRSSASINNLSNEKEPIFKEETLLLKVLIEGKSNLYEYVDQKLIRYFYSVDNNIEQLIYKKYYANEGNVGENNRFKQQLWTDLKCSSFTMSKIEKVNYKKKDLLRIFTAYAECHNDSDIIVNFETKEKRDLFNLTIRPRLNNSSFEIENSIYSSKDTYFNNEVGIGFGLEAEFILPFNKNKWSIAIEPTYQSFKSNKTTTDDNISGGKLIVDVNYNSIDLPISLRHYIFLNNNSKFFINASFIPYFSSKSTIEFKRDDNSILNSLNFKNHPNLGFGIGYKQNDKYSLEIKYQTATGKASSKFINWNTKYNNLALVFGYSLF